MKLCQNEENVLPYLCLSDVGKYFTMNSPPENAEKKMAV